MEIIRTPFPVPGSPKKDVALLAIGDIHGKFGLLQRILSVAKKILPKTANHTELVLLGDIIDRGDASIEILDLLQHGIEDWEVIPILGNHEQLLLRVLDASEDDYIMNWAFWRGNGGIKTLENLHITIPSLTEISVKEHRDILLKALGDDRVAYLNTFKSHYRNGDILCVHAGIDPKKSLEDNFSKDKLDNHPDHWAWIREGFLDHTEPFTDGVFVVHGHTVIPGPKLEPHRICLDTGGCVYGVLSGALFFNDEMTIFQVTQD